MNSDDVPWILAFGERWPEVKKGYEADWDRWQRSEEERRATFEPKGASFLEATLAQLARERDSAEKRTPPPPDPPEEWLRSR